MRGQLLELLKVNHAMTEAELAACLGMVDFEQRISLRRELTRLVDLREIQHFQAEGSDWYCIHQDRPGGRLRLGKVA